MLEQKKQDRSELRKRADWADALDAEIYQSSIELNAEKNRAGEQIKGLKQALKQRSSELKTDKIKAVSEIERLNKALKESADWAKSVDKEMARVHKELVAEKGRSGKQIKGLTQALKQRSDDLDTEKTRAITEIKRLNKALKESAGWAKSVDRKMARVHKELAAEKGRANKEIKGLTQALKQRATQIEAEKKKAVTEFTRLNQALEQQGNWAHSLDTELNHMKKDFSKTIQLLNTELKEQGDWARSLETRLEETKSEFSQTAQLLNATNDQLFLERKQASNDREIAAQEKEKLHQLSSEFENFSNSTKVEISSLQEQSRNWEALYLKKEEIISQILASHSWKLTKPLRVFTRLGRNLRDIKIYNPARWPYIFKRIRHSLAIRGFTGTLSRVQSHHEPQPQPDTQTLVDSHSIEIKQGNIEGISFPQLESPEVSIIIPLYNQYAYTQACLLSLLSVANKTTFEVILVDDCSTDETAQLLDCYSGITTLRNNENLGFIGSCNRGADAARGQYLVFLNNDTKVTDHWLDTLLATFSEFPKAGIVGSRLVYPDGSLQESGGIIFKDASGWNYGRNGNADEPKYQFAREVDYVSGAALMISAKLFNGFGGFDTHYSPAYYEDTDLAFKCRKAGYSVMVQPRSTVIHFEGISSGTDLSQGMKKYQLVNHKKFQQRWSTELKLQPDPIVDPDDIATVKAAAEHYKQKKLLLIDACTPQPDQDSGSVRIINMMRIFRDLGYQVTFFPDNRAWDGKYSEALQALGIEVLYNDWINNLPEFFANRGSEFETVVISRHYIAENYLSLLEKHMSQARFIFDTVDLHYLREQRHAELEQDQALFKTAARSRRAELKIINQADTTLVVSPFEKSILAHDAPDARVDIVSNIHPLHGSRKSFSERKDIFFVGGYQHPPNIDSAIWLANEIWPLIHAKLPEVNCYLLGSKAPPEVQKLGGDGLIFKGFVEQLEPWLDNCRIALAPLRYGAGVKGKVNMSMSFGQPVVASGIAVEGMYTENGREVLVADDVEGFAAEVVRLYENEKLWNKLSDNGLKNVDEHFSFAAARKNIVAMMEALDK
ncbi:MAG: glycosyltransferase [Proteobacteria bacterium]|nr:glycosyltransferase [Pseudomonadota bacterium]